MIIAMLTIGVIDIVITFGLFTFYMVTTHLSPLCDNILFLLSFSFLLCLLSLL